MLLSKKQFTSRFYISTFIVLLFLCLAAGSVILFKNQQKKASQTTTQISPTPSRIDTGEGSYAIATDIPNQMKFVSPKLGISFLYLSVIDAKLPKMLTKEEGNKVYIYPDAKGYNYHHEAYVQVFQKDPHDNLATAIEKTILKGYSPKDCFVEKQFHIYEHIPVVFETAIIRFPFDHNAAGINQEYIAASEKCPPKYTPTNYVAYFVMDKNHPDKFVFFYIGQQPTMAASDITADETLQFLP